MNPHIIRFPLLPIVSAVGLALAAGAAGAQVPNGTPALATVTVEASADASAQGLAKPYAGGQVARGARAGVLGTQDFMETPFSATSYTSELI